MSKSPITNINPEMIQWALERSDTDHRLIDEKAPNWNLWLMGESSPTFRELEKFSELLRVPIGYFFLDAPLEDDDFRPEFRTFGNQPVVDMSANLREVLLINQARQDWYREFATRVGLPEIEFVSSIIPLANIKTTANLLTESLGIAIDSRTENVADFLSKLISQVEELGILVVKVGFAGTNTSRKLDPEEFRGFALSDGLAPLIFINGADTQRAQIFSLIHEFLHLGVGISGLTTEDHKSDTEIWTNKVVAETLVPEEFLRAQFQRDHGIESEITRIGDTAKCSQMVVAKALKDAGLINRQELDDVEEVFINRYLEHMSNAKKSSGGDYYLSKPYQTSRRFALALIKDTWTSGTSFTEALSLLQIRSLETFDRFATKLGVG